MEFIELKKQSKFEQNKRLVKVYSNLEKILNELRKREIPIAIVVMINNDIELINSFFGSDRQLLRLMRKVQTKIIQLLEKQLKIVAKNYYRNLWLAIGMTAFGIPLGVGVGASLGNTAYMGLGISLGMVFGIAVGTIMDKKAKKEGRQLDIELQ